MTSDPNNPEVVASQLTELEAMAIVDYLRERGFDAHPSGANVAALYGTFRPLQSAHVVVRQSEAEQARKAIDDFQRK